MLKNPGSGQKTFYGPLPTMLPYLVSLALHKNIQQKSLTILTTFTGGGIEYKIQTLDLISGSNSWFLKDISFFLFPSPC